MISKTTKVSWYTMVTEMFPVVDSATGVSDSVGGAINDDNDTLLEK